MLPYTHDFPSASTQSSMCCGIPTAVATKFLTPEHAEFRLPCWQAPSVPEVAVYKYGHLRVLEHQVWRARQISRVERKSIACGAKCGREAHLYVCMFGTDAAHTSSTLRLCQIVHLATLVRAVHPT